MKTTLSWGYGAEIAARIAIELFTIWMRRSAASARSTPGSAYHPQLEAEILPQVNDLASGIENLLHF